MSQTSFLLILISPPEEEDTPSSARVFLLFVSVQTPSERAVLPVQFQASQWDSTTALAIGRVVRQVSNEANTVCFSQQGRAGSVAHVYTGAALGCPPVTMEAFGTRWLLYRIAQK